MIDGANRCWFLIVLAWRECVSNLRSRRTLLRWVGVECLLVREFVHSPIRELAGWKFPIKSTRAVPRSLPKVSMTSSAALTRSSSRAHASRIQMYGKSTGGKLRKPQWSASFGGDAAPNALMLLPGRKICKPRGKGSSWQG